MIMFSSYIITLLLVDILIFIFACVALVYSVKISIYYNKDLLNPKQYCLAKKGYLVSTVVMFILLIKIPLFLFFVWSMDFISFVVPGAMCAAGIVDATDYGIYMLTLKIINLFLLSGWLFLNYEDFKTPTCNFMKKKFKFFIPLFFLIAAELFFEISHFSNIAVDKPVLCCSVIFKPNEINTVSFWHSNFFVLSLFYVMFVFCYVSAYLKIDILLGIFSFIFMLSSIYAIIRFFSPYIYELPTHKCPFCMLQSEYNYIGYLIYILIFLGTVPGIFAFISKIIKIKLPNFWYKMSIFSNLALVVLLSSYPILYRFKNGVWL